MSPPETRQETHFLMRFDSRTLATLFRLVPTGSITLLDKHQYTITSRRASPLDPLKTVNITVINGGGPVKPEVIRQYGEFFEGFRDMEEVQT